MNPSYLNTVQGMTQLYEIQSSTEIEVATVGQNKWRYVVKPATLQTMSPTSYLTGRRTAFLTNRLTEVLAK